MTGAGRTEARPAGSRRTGHGLLPYLVRNFATTVVVPSCAVILSM